VDVSGTGLQRYIMMQPQCNPYIPFQNGHPPFQTTFRKLIFSILFLTIPHPKVHTKDMCTYIHIYMHTRMQTHVYILKCKFLVYIYVKYIYIYVRYVYISHNNM